MSAADVAHLRSAGHNSIPTSASVANNGKMLNRDGVSPLQVSISMGIRTKTLPGIPEILHTQSTGLADEPYRMHERSF